MWPNTINPLFEYFSGLGLGLSLIITIVLCLLFSFPAIKRKWLSPQAMSATSMIATFLVYKFGIAILIFPFLFALTGSILSKKQNQGREKLGRTPKQVFANAGVAILFALIIQDKYVAIPMVIFVFAIALSDTLSSEIGKRFKGPTFDICKWKKLQPGLSGGVSFVGSLAGLLGSGIIALASLVFTFDLRFFITVIIIGFIGMLIDSILGSLIQAKYLNNNIITESGKKEELISGFHWIDNDKVNFLSILITISVLLILKSYTI